MRQNSWKNFLDVNRKMFFKEYKEWFLSQPNDKFFIKNKFLFLKKLIYLFLVLFFQNFKDFFKKMSEIIIVSNDKFFFKKKIF